MVRKEKKIIPLNSQRAMFDKSTIDVDNRTIEVVFATENEVVLWNWDYGKIREVLVCNDTAGDLSRLNNGAPLLDSHSRYSVNDVLGTIDKAWFSNGVGRAIIRFSKRGSVDDIWNDVVDGILTGISVGYQVRTYETTENETELPLYRAIKWIATEVSLTPVQADAGAGVGRSKQDETNNYEVTILRNINDTKMSKVQKNASAKTAAQNAIQPIAGADNSARALENDGTDNQDGAADDGTDEEDTTNPADEGNAGSEGTRSLNDPEKVRKQERYRINQIRMAARALSVSEEYAQELIDKGIVLDRARALIIDKVADMHKEKNINPAQSGITLSGKEESQKRSEGIQVALTLRSGEVAEKDVTEEQRTYARSFRNHSLIDIARESLVRSGMSEQEVRTLDKMEMVGRSFTQSTSDFPVLLEGTIKRVLLAAYAIVPDTWRKFCTTGTLSDFRPSKRLRLGSFGNLKLVKEGGEYKTVPIDDAAYETASLNTKGLMVNLTRQAIINDDLGAFTRIAAGLGRAAARSIETDVYALLKSNPDMQDGKALFHADHGNLVDGSALSVNGLDAENVQMGTQKDLSGNDFLDIRPEILLVPLSLQATATVLIGAEYDVTQSVKSQVPNKVRNIVQNIIGTPRLTGAGHYLFANPAVAPVIEVDFLDGIQTPFLENKTGWNVDGTEWKIRLDYGVNAVDYKGALYNPGE